LHRRFGALRLGNERRAKKMICLGGTIGSSRQERNVVMDHMAHNILPWTTNKATRVSGEIGPPIVSWPI
jgi:hypothetical protein